MPLVTKRNNHRLAESAGLLVITHLRRATGNRLPYIIIFKYFAWHFNLHLISGFEDDLFRCVGEHKTHFCLWMRLFRCRFLLHRWGDGRLISELTNRLSAAVMAKSPEVKLAVFGKAGVGKSGKPRRVLTLQVSPFHYFTRLRRIVLDTFLSKYNRIRAPTHFYTSYLHSTFLQLILGVKHISLDFFWFCNQIILTRASCIVYNEAPGISANIELEE